MTDADGIRLVPVTPAAYHSEVASWLFPEDVASILALCDYTIYGTQGYCRHGNGRFEGFCDVWKRSELLGDAEAVNGRVFDSEWVGTPEESIAQIVKWVRDGMPDGFGEATGKKE